MTDTNHYMDKAKSLLEHLKKYCGISQEFLARALNVKQSTVSNLLRGKSNNPELQGKLLQLLLAEYNDALRKDSLEGKDRVAIAEADKAAMEELAEFLGRHESIRKDRYAGHLGNPNAPLSGYNANYIKRSSDGNILRGLGNRPADIALTGGPKTGKTSLLNMAAETMASELRILFIRFKDPQYLPFSLAGKKRATPDLAAFYAALSSDILQAIHEDKPVDGLEKARPDTFLPWLVEHVLAVLPGDIGLFFDDLHLLREDILDNLLNDLRSIMNRRSTRPAFTRMSFIVTVASLCQDLMTVNPYLSDYLTVCARVTLDPLDATQMTALAKSHGVEDATAVDKALNYTGGHPFLANEYLASLSESEKAAEAAVVDALDKRILPRLKDMIASASYPIISPGLVDLLNLLQKNPPGKTPKKYYPQAKILAMTGLFHWNTECPTQLESLTPWMRDAFAELAEELQESHA